MPRRHSVTTDQQETPQELTGATETPAQGAEAQESQGQENAQENGSEEVETFDRAYVEKLRQENADWRTKYREAQDSLSKAKSPEDYQALERKLGEVQHNYERNQWISSATKSLPDDLVTGLVWPDTEDAIKAMASSLAKHVVAHTKSTDNLRGGLDPSEKPQGNASPGELAARYNKRMRR